MNTLGLRDSGYLLLDVSNSVLHILNHGLGLIFDIKNLAKLLDIIVKEIYGAIAKPTDGVVHQVGMHSSFMPVVNCTKRILCKERPPAYNQIWLLIQHNLF